MQVSVSAHPYSQSLTMTGFGKEEAGCIANTQQTESILDVRALLQNMYSVKRI
jgi:hypothetical protein